MLLLGLLLNYCKRCVLVMLQLVIILSLNKLLCFDQLVFLRCALSEVVALHTRIVILDAFCSATLPSMLWQVQRIVAAAP
mmetsp:Transcript_20088/g.33394  ORF Transcript_20088/g.33394 Transcript_20088/m.33394 type:complete len:80 (-) Transcript_20088:39-278(-)